MKTTLLSLAVLFSSRAMAVSHTVTVKVDGESYFCGGGGGGATDPACAKKVTDYCYSKTSYSSDQCYNKASTACKGQGTNYPACVQDATDYCYSKTAMSATQCFDKSLDACSGSFASIRSLMESAAAQAQSTSRR